MQKTFSPKRTTVSYIWQTLTTVWPQLAAGMIFAGMLLVTASHPSAPTFTLSVGAGLLFTFTIAYLYFTKRGSHSTLSLLTWMGGIAFSIFCAFAFPNFLALSVLFAYAAVCYGLGASGRISMMIGTLAAWLVLAFSFTIHLLSFTNVLNIGIAQPSPAMEAGMCVFGLMLAADTMQRLWRHYNRNAAAVAELRLANEALMRTRTSLEKHLNEQAELLEVSRVIGSTQELEPLLDEILTQLKRVMDYGMATALTLQNGKVIAMRHVGIRFEDPAAALAGLVATPHWKCMLDHKRPVVVNDIYQDKAFLEPFQVATDKGAQLDVTQHSWLGLPLIVRGELVGALSVTSSIAGYFDASRIDMAFAFANHAAVAVESSRTREEAVRAAALAERTRLARELHDSVSQALFGMVLSTRTSLELIDTDPAKARNSMCYTIDLADAALSEMRALIFELRPESLQEEGLLAALRKQTAALTLRNKLDLQLDLCTEEPALPIETKEALYRITLEAIQNTVRHASARRLRIAMSCGEQVSLSISDDGCGFNPQREYPGHFGLHSMRECARAVGGHVTIDSWPGEGVRVHIALPTHLPALLTNVSAAA
jgi:signal transduction histidine kinase